MAQTTKSRSKSSATRNGSRAKTRTKSSATRNGSGAKPTTSRSSTSRSSTSAKRSAPQQNNTVMSRARAAGRTVADAASKAKTPLIAGGTALVGAAAGVVVKDRLDSSGSKGPLKRLRGASLPNPAKNLGKVDLDTVKSVADRMSTYGRQASDIAEAVDKARKTNK